MGDMVNERGGGGGSGGGDKEIREGIIDLN